MSFHRFSGLKEFKKFLYQVDAACRFMVQAMSGMRTDELYRMHSEYGLQSTTVQGQLIYLLTTRQSKIVKGKNSINDVYVTSKFGAKAYQLMNAI
ncbi:site-specific integrase, partial [Vibrio sp. F13]